MKELAKEYRQSLRELNKHINKLKDQKNALALQPYSPEIDDKIEELGTRLSILNSMSRDLKAVAQEIENYYDRSWWRSEVFTFNQR